MGDIAALIGRPRMRSEAFLTMDDYARLLTLDNFPLFLNQTLKSDREEIDGSFSGLVTGAYRSNGIVFACIVARMLIFRQARFQFQQLRNGQPGDLFGTPELRILEEPEPSMTTGDLLGRALLDADLAGNWFGVRRPGRIKRVRPDWMAIILGSPNRDAPASSIDIDAEVVGYVYRPGGLGSDEEPVALDRREVAHFAPIPDPLASYRGMSWLTALVREVRADTAATRHKGAFFDNAATPNLIVKFPPTLTNTAVAKEFIELFEQDHVGAFNAYRTLYLLGGADVDAVGRDFQQMDFKATQGAGETRIAAAARVPAAILGISEGLQGSALQSGTYNSAKRNFADGTIRELWSTMAGSVQSIVPPPGGSRMWYDDRHIPFLRDDLKDEAEVLFKEAQAIRTLWDGGADPDSAIDAIASRDVRRLQHSGYLSVQMQPARPPDSLDVDSAAAGWIKIHERSLRPQLPRPVGSFTATREFWASSGPAEGLHVDAGTVLDADHYLVRAFPQMFEQGEAVPMLAGGEPIDVRCSGVKKDGTECRALLWKWTGTRPVAHVGLETKCHQCGTVVAA